MVGIFVRMDVVVCTDLNPNNKILWNNRSDGYDYMMQQPEGVLGMRRIIVRPFVRLGKDSLIRLKFISRAADLW